MKKRTILPIAGLVVLSGIAAISGTFAWFQTVRSATITFDDAVIRSRDSNLKVELISSLNTLEAGQQNADVIEGINDAARKSEFGDIKLNINKDSQFITDISGNGDKFYKLEQGYRHNDNTAKLEGVSWQIPLSIDDVSPSAAGSADGYLVDFTLRLSRTDMDDGDGRALEVYIGSNTNILPVTPSGGDADQLAKDQKAVDGSRLSVKVGAAAPKLYAPVAEEANVQRWTGYDDQGDATYAGFDNSTPLYMYLTETGDDQDTAYQVEEFKLVSADVELLGSNITDHVTSPAVPANDEYYVTTLTDVYDDTDANSIALTSVDVNIRMWIEGTDADVGFSDENVAVGGKIKLVLDLYTLHVGKY